MSNMSDEESRDKLLKTVKKEVKQIMEEAVTRKFVHEESGSIISLCAAVDACLSQGLKRRAVGLFKGNNTTFSLLKQLSKNYSPAHEVLQKVQEIELRLEANKKHSNGDSPSNHTPQQNIRTALQQKHLWIRVALFEKYLAKICEHVSQNGSKYYDKDSLMSDPVDGPILASLLVGPCALDYSKMKTADHYWTDPPADELVQRHRIHSAGPGVTSGSNSPRRPGLQVKKTATGTTAEEHCRTPVSARDYVESLHQNSRSTLLYGKNNVLVQPKEDIALIPGYLSLHQTALHLTIKWTPNQLMNGGGVEETEMESEKRHFDSLVMRLRNGRRKIIYWDYAVTVNVEDIVYLHCHQQPDSGGTLVLVGQDGVQYPPIHFPKGGHLLAFLTCLENGLLPRGQLDPPLWSQRGKGKVLPKLRRKSSKSSGLGVASSQDGTQIFEGDEATDYVFRIITSFRPEFIPEEASILPIRNGGSRHHNTAFPWTARDMGPRHALIRQQEVAQSPTSSSPSPVQLPPAIPYSPVSPTSAELAAITSRSSIRILCDTMRRQIISRAFYGWLAHCRHLRTVRTHLSGLVHPVIITKEMTEEASLGLTCEKWAELFNSEEDIDEAEVMRLIYFGGMDHEIRREVWPYLLGHYKLNSTEEERGGVDEGVRLNYEQILAEWMAVEAIIRQRDKDNQQAKLSSENSSEGQIPLTGHDPSLDSEVFEIDDDNDEYVESGEVIQEVDQADLTKEQQDFVQKEDYVVLSRCRSPRQDTLETETGRSLGSEVSGDVPCEVIASGKMSPPGSDEGFGDASSITDSTSRHSSRLASSSYSYDSREVIHEGHNGDICSDAEDIDVLKKAHFNEADEEGSGPEVIATNGGGKAITVELVNGKSHEKEDEEAGENEKEEDDDEDEGDATICSSRSSADPVLEMKGLNIPEASSHLMADMATASPASSNGGVYSNELLDSFSLNLHRIDKDVQRCDRNYHYFTSSNLEKLRNVMCTYVWEHLDVGYVQGMCDLVAPLLVILDDEAKSYSCFCELMKRMSKNFPHGGAMDTHFANMRSLIQILDCEMFELMHQNGDYTHFYFCYRWFLLDFKRELVYDDTFAVWETIWAAKHCASGQMVLFIALALVEYYRDIILDNNMDFTDIIKFFNEMAEHHDAKAVLKIARELVHRVQSLIENQ
ncbi:small G protein signaling modulator 2-like isoform X2 [Lytechinus variegatus]|uniref:small G protein signaling modulator 2-like isoform X2 n=1 Tax=Lytechinus variegatus TaxID=7654 RepID=UPI001BB1C9CE|nr:small G protein signaling modulator 2-like isoform X2 [Lytechinus variegatus]